MDSVYKLMNYKNNHGESTGDIAMETKDVTLDSGEAEVSTQVEPGTVVHYAVFKEATVDEDGNITVSNAAVADDDNVQVIVLSNIEEKKSFN